MRIAILLGTYNGATFLQAQLDSYLQQSYSSWELWVSDDGSTDSTEEMIKNFSSRVGGGRVNFLLGPQKGFSSNFLSLVCNPYITADAYAYSDQDDIWMADKLERASNYLNSVPTNTPALYCSRTLYVDSDDRPLGQSLSFIRPPVFKNALVQNIASGNTMVFNEAARVLLMQAGPTVNVGLHDWWTYLLITGCGGKVFFDQKPTVRYRQHLNNLWGMNTGFKAQFLRVVKLFKGRFWDWNERNILALRSTINFLTPQNRVVFDCFVSARKQPILSRIAGLRNSGVYRQTFIGNIGLLVAALFGKI